MKINKKGLIIGIICFIVLAILVTIGSIFLYNKLVVDKRETVDPNVAYQELLKEELQDKQMFAKETDDLDNDLISDELEKEIGTSITEVDSDKDGLSDAIEYTITNTNPLDEDSDKDGLFDGVEYQAELDPNNPKTDGETPDKEAKFEVEYKVEKCTLEVKGDANIYNINANINKGINLKNYIGVASEVYEFYMDNQNFDEATITFSIKDLPERFSAEDMCIYQYIPTTCEFEKVKSKVDLDKEIVTATLEHFSYYVLVDNSIFTGEQYEIKNVSIVLDNSGSMFPDELCHGSDENDVEFKRVDFAKELIETSDENTKFEVIKFTGRKSATIISSFDDSKEYAMEELDGIKTFKENFTGTYIIEACEVAIESIKDRDGGKYIVLLTDGDSTAYYEDIDGLVKNAQKYGITIIVIGLGKDVPEDYCSSFADRYIFINTVGSLNKLNNLLEEENLLNFVDLDNDGNIDYQVLAHSNFDATTDAFVFANPTIQYQGKKYRGNCFGIAAITQLNYRGMLPIKNDSFEKENSNGLPEVGPAYDLTQTHFFESYTNDEDFAKSIYLNKLSLYKGISNWSLDKFENRYVFDGDSTMLINDDYKEIIEETDLILLEKKKVKDDQYYYAHDKKTKYNQFENFYYNIDVDPTTLTEEELETYNVMNCMMHWLCMQNNRFEKSHFRYYSLNASSDNGKDAATKSFNMLVSDIKAGKLPIACSEYHAVTAIALYQDIKNPNSYILEVYDNNSPYETKFLTITKQKTIKATGKDLINESNVSENKIKANNEYSYTIYDPENVLMGNDTINLDFFISKLAE